MTLSEHLFCLAKCYKCDAFVTLDNNGALFDILVKQKTCSIPLIALATAQAFHLLPVIKDGVVVCIGSPSRAQYLEGQPRDIRPWIIYNSKRETSKRVAFAQMLDMCDLIRVTYNLDFPSR